MFCNSFNGFFRFKTHAAAEVALKRLHQLELLGHYISAEFARDQHDEPSYSSVTTRYCEQPLLQFFHIEVSVSFF